jgi:hypothetical protein
MLEAEPSCRYANTIIQGRKYLQIKERACQRIQQSIHHTQRVVAEAYLP